MPLLLLCLLLLCCLLAAVPLCCALLLCYSLLLQKTFLALHPLPLLLLLPSLPSLHCTRQLRS
jgi:hypothetical protein